MINAMLGFMGKGSPELKVGVFEFMMMYVPSLKKCDPKPLVHQILSMMLGKSQPERSIGNAMLKEVINLIGVKPFLRKTNDFKPAYKKSLEETLSKYEKKDKPMKKKKT